MSSILLGFLELHVAWPSGQFLYPIGYFGGGPQFWSPVSLKPPSAEERGVRFKARGLESNVGISFSYVDGGAWETCFDPVSGWLVYREPGAKAERAAMFADNCIAGLAQHRLVELWLKPEMIGSPAVGYRRSRSWLHTLLSKLRRTIGN
jgi:hypothetical protein